MNNLYVEKYRSKSLEEFIGSDDVKNKFQEFIDTQEIPNILLYGSPGCGKSTLAKILVNNIDCDKLIINASDERGIDIIRDKIKGFVVSRSFKKWKIVILEEADGILEASQKALRVLLEEYSEHARFILTCNYVGKIIPAIQSRCQSFSIIPPSKVDIAKHVGYILKQENITFEAKDIVSIVNLHYPDIRKVLNTCQASIIDNTVSTNKLQQTEEDKVLHDIIQTLTSKDKTKYTKLRTLVQSLQTDNYDNVYKFLFDNIETYTSNIPTCIIIIAEYMYQNNFVMEKDITLTACLYKLTEVI
jgi:DNA polymerase III delta prime subunit